MEKEKHLSNEISEKLNFTRNLKFQLWRCKCFFCTWCLVLWFFSTMHWYYTALITCYACYFWANSQPKLFWNSISENAPNVLTMHCNSGHKLGRKSTRPSCHLKTLFSRELKSVGCEKWSQLIWVHWSLFFFLIGGKFRGSMFTFLKKKTTKLEWLWRAFLTVTL